jgi:hypothetical protein
MMSEKLLSFVLIILCSFFLCKSAVDNKEMRIERDLSVHLWVWRPVERGWQWRDTYEGKEASEQIWFTDSLMNLHLGTNGSLRNAIHKFVMKKIRGVWMMYGAEAAGWEGVR